MKFNKILLAFISMGLMAGAASCVEDNSIYGSGMVTTLKVNVPTSDKMPEMNFNYGEECVVKPDVSYSGSKTLTYEWSVGSYEDQVRGNLTKVSNEQELRYKFPKGGVYYAHLTITDGEVGTVQEWQLNVNRTFESGWTIISNNAKGEGNLCFIKDLTPEEIAAGKEPIIMEHSLEKTNDGIPVEKLVGGIMIHLTWPTDITRVCVSTATKGYFLDPNTFTAISTIDYTKASPGFEADYLCGSASNPKVTDYGTGKWITLDGANMFGYMPESWQGHKTYALFSGSYESWGNINYNHVYVKSLNPLQFENNSGYHAYFDLPDWIDSSEMTWNGAPAFENEELVTAFQGEGVPGTWSTYYYMYIITRNKQTGKIYNNYISDFGDTAYGFDFKWKVEIPSEGKAVPASMSSIAASDTYHRTYFYNGNKVYTMLPDGNSFSLPTTEQASLSFAADEEVTYLAINVVNGKERLFVATCNKGTGRGSLYIYNPADVRTDNPGATPLNKYLNCADRITSAFYKPSITK